MTTTICDKTGVMFEAKTTRTKNHPAVSALLTDAQKTGNYAAAVEACKAAKAAGVTTIEAALDIINARLNPAAAAKKAAEESARKATNDAESERKNDARRRDELNRKLRTAGYRWQVAGGMDESMADREAVGNLAAGMPVGMIDAVDRLAASDRWILLDPAGKPVAIETARAAIGA